jgi:hypothetical protein
VKHRGDIDVGSDDIPSTTTRSIAEASRPAVMRAGKRPAGCPKVSDVDDIEILNLGNESFCGAAAFDEPPGDSARMTPNETTGPAAVCCNMVVRHRKDSSSNSFALAAPNSRASLRTRKCWTTAEHNRCVPLMAARTHHFDRTGKVARRKPGLAQIVGLQSGQRDSGCPSSILEGF